MNKYNYDQNGMNIFFIAKECVELLTFDVAL